MTLPSLDRDALLTNINPDELDGLASQAQKRGQEDPVETAIAAGLSELHLYVDPHLVPDSGRDVMVKIWKILTIGELYNRVSTVPEKRENEMKWARTILREVRDGKFFAIPLDPVAPSAAPNAFGSATKLTHLNPAQRSDPT